MARPAFLAKSDFSQHALQLPQAERFGRVNFAQGGIVVLEPGASIALNPWPRTWLPKAAGSCRTDERHSVRSTEEPGRCGCSDIWARRCDDQQRWNSAAIATRTPQVLTGKYHGHGSSAGRPPMEAHPVGYGYCSFRSLADSVFQSRYPSCSHNATMVVSDSGKISSVRVGESSQKPTSGPE
jgi:hypothetical protein